MFRPMIVLAFAAAMVAASGASAQTSFPPPAKVIATWPRLLEDTTHTYYREPEIARSGTSAIVWRMAQPTPSMSRIGVATIYTRLEFDCATGRRKILAIAYFNADGSPKAPPAKDVELNKWFDTIAAADVVLLKQVCPGR
jgi:hypothetical protein